MLFVGVGIGVLCVIAGLPLGIRGNDEREWKDHKNDKFLFEGEEEKLEHNIPTEIREKERLTLPPTHYIEEVREHVPKSESSPTPTTLLFKPNVVVLVVMQALAVTLFLKYHVGDQNISDKKPTQSTPSEVSLITTEKSNSEKSTTSAQSDSSIRHRQHAGTRTNTPPPSDQIITEPEDIKKPFRIPKSAYVWGLVVIAVTFLSIPSSMSPKVPSVQHVFFYAWITDLATGMGVLPFLCLATISSEHLGYANSIAAGMMSSASVQLFIEAVNAGDLEGGTFMQSALSRCIAGMLLGFVFIFATKQFLDKYDDIKLGDLTGLDARRVLLIMMVMTLHSFTEGVGIGVSFGGERGARVGFCVAVCLTIHNIPEGVAVALVLIPRGIDKLTTTLLCILTSLPQPLMAVPAFIFVATFLPLLPVGLGFAAGAMLWVAFFELLTEAASDLPRRAVAATATISFASAYILQQIMTDE